MFERIKNRLLGDNYSKQRSREDLDELQKNPLNEIQILEGHTDIVRLLIKVDGSRLASASDDGNIIIWNCLNGRRITTLKGHSLAITCIALIGAGKLISGSADKTIRMWNLESEKCIVLRAHQGSIKCVASLNPGSFCSGANDPMLCIWKSDTGELLNTINRTDNENMNALLPITNDRLITANTSSFLHVYSTQSCNYIKLLSYHRESVRCLVRVSGTMFASASMDGAIVVWNAESLTTMRILQSPDEYRSKDRVYIYDVKYLLVLGEKYLAAAIGVGFRIFDVFSGECLMECKHAHEMEVSHLLCLYDGKRIISCSADGSIRLWGTSQPINFRKKREKTSDSSSVPRIQSKMGRSRTSSSSSISPKVEPILLGEMLVHSDGINQLLTLSEKSFASCSNDRTLILWKDGHDEAELRNVYAFMALQQYQSQQHSNHHRQHSHRHHHHSRSNLQQPSHSHKHLSRGDTQISEELESSLHLPEHRASSQSFGTPPERPILEGSSEESFQSRLLSQTSNLNSQIITNYIDQ